MLRVLFEGRPMKLRLDEFDRSELEFLLDELDRIGENVDERPQVGKSLREAHQFIEEAIHVGTGPSVDDWTVSDGTESPPGPHTTPDD